jgi:hypothetical protein
VRIVKLKENNSKLELFLPSVFAYGLWTLCWLWNKLVFLSRAQIKMTSSSCCASKVYNLLEGCVKGIEQLWDAMGPVSRGVLWVHSDSRKVLYLGPTGVMIGVWCACPFFPLYSCNHIWRAKTSAALVVVLKR